MRLFLFSVFCIGSMLSPPSAQCAHAVVSLKKGNQITGELSSIDTKGNIKILSPVSSATLEIIHSSVLDIVFSDKLTTTKHASELVLLNNGDLLPCSLLSLDRTSVSLNTWYAEDFKIPTSTVSNIEFHTRPDSIIYSGPNDDDIWDTNTNWSLKPKALRCLGKGEISRKLDLSQNFIFRSTVTWNSPRPKFKIYFCSDSSEAEDMKESYFLDISTNAIHVIRSSKFQARAQIGEIPVRLREFPTNSLDIEIHLDRKTKTILVTINGENYGLFDDTSFRAPSGKFINFVSNLQQNSDSLTVSNISISQWRGSHLSYGNDLSELDLDRDTLFDTEGDKLTGEIQQLSREQKELTFEVEYSVEPLLVPLDQIKSLYFSNTESETMKDPARKYILSLQGGGSLSVDSILLSKTQILATHPILGEITLKPRSLQKITATSNTDE
ncbi:hypothetical protein BSZ32_04595 [Rubritalea profundi]|uniref:Uncharacterized protein n=2 Tax=Rubritalea profundi TaxID=1658618 RepID=A0A2S7U018_9BACT|nr:hypothetical protein BSZ32_04595 [Rubritalea profundi]